MVVYGYDPFMSVDAAWRLSRDVIRAEDVDTIYAKADYISINVPYNDQTHHMFDDDAFGKMKKGVRIVNESRAEVVDDEAMTRALDCGRVGKYVTDFPNKVILQAPNVIALPHIGACTPESEDRCAAMAAMELYDYLLNGNIKNSVNLPDATLSRMGVCRLCVQHQRRAHDQQAPRGVCLHHRGPRRVHRRAHRHRDPQHGRRAARESAVLKTGKTRCFKTYMVAKPQGSIPRSTRRKTQNAAKRRADEGVGPSFVFQLTAQG